MKLSLRKFGGVLPSRGDLISVDLASVPSPDAAQLEALVQRVFSKEQRDDPLPSVPDMQSYRLTLDNDDRPLTLRLTDLSVGPDEAELIERIEALHKAKR